MKIVPAATAVAAGRQANRPIDPSSDRLRRPPSPARGEGVKHGRSALLIPRPKTRRMLLLTSSRGKGAWPATDCGGGGRSSGEGPRGILGRSGASACWLNPPAVGVVEDQGACLGLLARLPRPLGSSGNGGARVPVRPQQGHPPGRWRITVARSVWLRRNGTPQTYSGRRPALRVPFHPFSGDRKSVV